MGDEYYIPDAPPDTPPPAWATLPDPRAIAAKRRREARELAEPRAGEACPRSYPEAWRPGEHDGPRTSAEVREARRPPRRSEDHTSQLQSLLQLV